VCRPTELPPIGQPAPTGDLWRSGEIGKRSRKSGRRTAPHTLVVCGANDAHYRACGRAGVAPAMPVFIPAFLEERRQGRRRGSLKGRSTDRAR
jgi:hypothetical protein